MNLLKLFTLSLLLGLPLEHGALAQTKQKPCPNNSGQNIWIKDKTNPNNYREGKPRKLVDMNDKEKKLVYCVGDHLAEEDLSSLVDVSFVPPGIVTTTQSAANNANNRTVQTGQTVGNSAQVIPDHTATVSAIISSPTDFSHSALSGKVTLDIELYENGRIGRIDVVDSTETALEAVAKEEAKKLKFTPGIHGGQWVNVRKRIVFNFFRSPANPTNSAPNAGAGNQSTGPTSTGSQASSQSEAAFPTFKLLKPESGIVVNRSEQILQWQPVANTFGYRVEVLCGFNLDSCHSERIPGSQTSYNLKFLGDGPVKWRVVAERKNGTTAVSDWGYFGYKK